MTDQKRSNLPAVGDDIGLRDYFAAQALIALLTKADLGKFSDNQEIFVARQAYRFADAMVSVATGADEEAEKKKAETAGVTSF